MSAAAARVRRSGNVNAEIDETLFGGRNKTRTSSAGLARNGTAIISAKTLQAITANPQMGNTKESVVITGRDLGSILSMTGTLGGTTGSNQQRFGSTTRSNSATPSQQESIAARAATRKEKMLRLEREASNRPGQLTLSEFEEKENRNRLLGQAKQAMDEEMDDVKHMNQMMLYAQCVTIRDAQILEKVRGRKKSREEQVDKSAAGPRFRPEHPLTHLLMLLATYAISLLPFPHHRVSHTHSNASPTHFSRMSVASTSRWRWIVFGP